MIEAYLAVLRRELRGPFLIRAGMIREIRHGLDDAVRARTDTGVSRPEAEQMAVDEFGPATMVAAEMRTELAATTGRYLGIVAFAMGAAQFVLSQRNWQAAAAAEQAWPTPSPAYATLADAVDVVSIAFLVVSALGVLVLGAGSRVLPTRRPVRMLAYAALAVLAFDAVACTGLLVYAPAHVGTGTGLDAVLNAAATVLYVVWTAALARRCLWLTSMRRAAAEDAADDAAEL